MRTVLVPLQGALIAIVCIFIGVAFSPELAYGINWALAEVGTTKQLLLVSNETPKVTSRSTFSPEAVTSRTRVVYVKEYSDWKPKNGAPIFYAPYPDTLCMLGEGSRNEVRIIYEKRTGACEKLIQVSDGHLVRPIKKRQGGDSLYIGGGS